MFEPVAAAILTMSSISSMSGQFHTEQIRFSDVSFRPPGPTFGSIAHGLSFESAGANSAVLSFTYSQDGGPLGSRISDLEIVLYTTGETILLAPIPGAPDGGGSGNVRFQSRRFFFDPAPSDGPWTIVASQQAEFRSTEINLSGITLTTAIRPEPFVVDDVLFNDGFWKRDSGAHPYKAVSFTVDANGEYDLLADWRNLDPAPGEGWRFDGEMFLLEGYFKGDLDNLAAVGHDWLSSEHDLIEPIALQRGKVYTVLLSTLVADTNPVGYSADLTITGDGNAKLAPGLAPRKPRRR